MICSRCQEFIPKGEEMALMHAFLPVHNNYMHKVASSLDRQEKELLISLLRKLNKGLESV